jgi:hypothetical protein
LLSAVRGEEGKATCEQVAGGAGVATVPRTAAGGGETARGARRQRVRFLVGWAQFGPIAAALLEVVAEDLLVFVDALAGEELEPSGELFVEQSAEFLGCSLVGRVAEQDVLEAEGGFADEAGRSW